jgi:HAD superfamily hydrolase (TIGR01490 family)
MSATELNQLHKKFMSQIIEPLKLSQANDLIEKHRQSGDRLLVITATNRLVVEPIIESLDINEFLATDPEIISGRVTGKIIGTPTFREGKVERLEDWLTENDESLEGSYFYSDSINDLPLLQKVDHPVAVDPDDALHRESERRGWSIISLRN